MIHHHHHDTPSPSLARGYRHITVNILVHTLFFHTQKESSDQLMQVMDLDELEAMDLDELEGSIKRVSKTPRQLSLSMTDQIADMIRPNITAWLENDTSSDRKSGKTFIDELKNNYIQRTRFPKLDQPPERDWRAALKSVAQELELEHGPIVMETVVNKWLSKTRSPDATFVRPKAYKWLRHLEHHPPKNANWFPKHAIEVAFKSFRLRGTLKSFKKYLCVKRRQQNLPTIMPQVHVAGLFRLC